MPGIDKILPAAAWLRGYTPAALRGDLAAGLTVGVMLIPMSMAYAILAGVPPIYGLYASVVPLVAYALLGTSRHLAVGTVALDMVIVAVGLGALAAGDAGAYIALAVTLAALVGLIQIGMGLAGLGFVVHLLSRPVIVGFTSAAALIIGFSQLGNLLGVEIPRTQQVVEIVVAVAGQAARIDPMSVLIGLGAVVVLLGLRRWPRVPGPLVVVVLGTLLVVGLRLDRAGVAIVGAVPTGLPAPSLPLFDLETFGMLLPTALTLVLVQFMSIISLGKVFAARNGYHIDADRELIALGAANFAGSFFRSIPVSGSFSRTAVNEQSGAQTPMANVVAAGLVALTLAFLTPLFEYLPIPALAAIIMVAAFGLLDVGEVRLLLKAKRIDGGLAIVTFLATLGIGIQEGILVGVAASVVAILYRISRPNVALLGHLPGTRSFGDLERNPEAHPIDGILMLRVDASFSFANADFVRDLILERSHPPAVRAVIIDASSINDLDMTAAAMVRDVAERLAERGVDLYFGGMKAEVNDVMARSGLLEIVGADHIFLSPHRAVKHVLGGWDGRLDAYLEEVPGGQESVAP